MVKKRRKLLSRYIVVDPNICHGKPTFVGTRVMVAQVLRQVARGMPRDKIVAEWRNTVSKQAIADAVKRMTLSPENGDKMAPTERRYSKEEFARRGDAIYESDVAPHLKSRDNGKFVAIDIDSGNYEVDADELGACDRLSARVPSAQIWLVRVGSRAVHRFGGRERRSA